MNDAGESWESRGRVEKLVGQLLALSRDETACRVLGVDGVVAEQVDISFLDDPLDYVAYDLAVALMATDEEHESPADVPPLLATLVAEVKLCQLVLGRLDETDLVSRTLNHLRQ